MTYPRASGLFVTNTKQTPTTQGCQDKNVTHTKKIQKRSKNAPLCTAHIRNDANSRKLQKTSKNIKKLQKTSKNLKKRDEHENFLCSKKSKNALKTLLYSPHTFPGMQNPENFKKHQKTSKNIKIPLKKRYEHENFLCSKKSKNNG